MTNSDQPGSLDHMIASSDIADLAGVTRTVISNWKTRHADFPKPIGTLAGTDIYDRAAIVAWLTGMTGDRLERAKRNHASAVESVVKTEKSLAEALELYNRVHGNSEGNS